MNEMSHLRAATLDDLKAVQLEILLHVAAFCKEHHIRYWLDCGTLLGAVRHKGYIPWDDDIDVGMLREDYNRFMEEFNRSNTKYRFVCIENTEDYFLPYGKVVDTDTLLFEPDINGYKLAINIDIFPYDHIPDDPKAVKRMYDWRDFWRLCAEMSFSTHILPGDSIFKRACKTVAHGLCALHSPAYYTRKCIQNARRLEHVSCSHVGNMTSFARMSSPKSVFDSFVPVEFEGHQFDAPAGYDVWLTSFYGDYMQLPPEEKRVSHHAFEAYIKI